jgi:hypothetical protein
VCSKGSRVDDIVLVEKKLPRKAVRVDGMRPRAIHRQEVEGRIQSQQSRELKSFAKVSGRVHEEDAVRNLSEQFPRSSRRSFLKVKKGLNSGRI